MMEQMTEALAREELKRAEEGDTPMLSRAETLQLLQAWLDSDALRKDAERYRWLRNEAWAGYNQGRGRPHVFTVDAAGNRRTMLAEDALDSEVDAAIQAGAAKGPQ